MANWNSLPPEVRNKILYRMLPTDEACNNAVALATVSREWQACFEPKNFHRLILDQSRVADFGKIMRNRRKWMVKHIWLRIELPKYRCANGSCRRRETRQERHKNNQIFTNALFQLLKTLGSWGDRRVYDPVDGTGPVLELSVHSPSDMKHRFDVFAMDKDVYPHKFDEHCTRQEFSDYVDRKLQNDQTRGIFCTTANGNRTGVRHLRMFAKIDLDFSAIEYLQGRKKLPRVDSIKGLIIRRQYYRGFSPQMVAEIARSFHTIDSVTFEPITRGYRPCSRAFQQGYQDLIRQAYRFKSFSIFIGFYGRDAIRGPWTKLPNSFSLMLADETQSLEHLSAAFVGDALSFFQDFLQPGSQVYRPHLDPSRPTVQKILLERLSIAQRAHLNRLQSREEFEQALLKATGYEDGSISRSVYKPQWLKLKTLALGTHFNHRHDLFEAAGFAALEMPELQIMEIWDEDLGLDFVEYFRYSRHEEWKQGSPAITWFSGFETAPESRVITAWDRVARMHANQGIQMIIPGLPRTRKLPRYPYGVIEYLELREKIAHPISLHEFEWYYDDWTRPVEQFGEGRRRDFIQ